MPLISFEKKWSERVRKIQNRYFAILKVAKQRFFLFYRKFLEKRTKTVQTVIEKRTKQQIYFWKNGQND